MEEILKQILAELGSLKKGQERLEKGQDVLAEGQLKIESRMNKIETRMENEVIDKIKALNDARQVDHEVIIRIESKVDKMAASIESHDNEIKAIKRAK